MDGRLREVSGRVVQLLAELAAGEGIDAGRLFAGLPVDPQAPPKWVDWDVYCEALDRLQEAAGGPDALARISERLVFADALAPFARMLRLVLTPERLYRFINLWIGPMLVPPLLNEHRELGPGRLLLRLRIPPQLRDSPAFFHHAVGTMRSGPRLIGLPAAYVQVEVAPREATYQVVVPQQPGLGRRLRRSLDVLRRSTRDSTDSFVAGIEHLITLRAELARRYREADALRRDAEEGLQRRRALLRELGREVREPMAQVIDAAQRLLHTDLDPEQREQATIARDCARDLLEAVRSASEPRRPPPSSPPPAPGTFEPRRLAERVLRLVEHAARSRGNALALVVHEGVPERVRGDGGKVRQVLLNLVDNAVRFTSSGRVEVRVEVAPRPDGQRPTGPSALVFEVIDSGIGLSEEARARLFRPFEQADASTARRFGGTGLGLSIAKALVEEMGGTIHTSPAPHGGSSFAFVVPVEAC